MFCPNCTAELTPGSQFCAKCETTIPNPTPSVVPPVVSDTSLSVSAPPPHSAFPPYARFVSMALAFGLCLSVVAFNAAHNLGQGYWRVSAIAVVAGIAAIVLMLWMPRVWQRIETHPDELGHHKKLLWRSIFFVLLFMTTAIIVRLEIGKDGRATGQLEEDLQQMTFVGGRISEARSSVEPNVPSHIVMYKAIEPDVQEFDAILRKIQSELPAYDERFPDQHEQTLKSIDSVNTGLKRSSLLQQQIVVARDIESLDPAPRFQAWQERMQPLLDAETALDKKED